jgi:hypothetical protein
MWSYFGRGRVGGLELRTLSMLPLLNYLQVLVPYAAVVVGHPSRSRPPCRKLIPSLANE